MSELIKQLQKAGLSNKPELPTEWVSTGSYALNWVISGSYNKGIPVGAMIQLQGGASTAKTVFVTEILAHAQKKGYHTAFADAENTLSPAFAQIFDLDVDKLIYSNPESIEDTFDWLSKVITTIRETDPKTPIILAIDSLPVLSPKKSLEDGNYEQENTDGMVRARIIGGCLRQFNRLLKKNHASLIIVNQIREKMVFMGDPETKAAGGRGLDFYLSVDLKTTSNKTSDLIHVDDKKSAAVIGIKGKIKCVKNKISLPYKSCEFELFFDKGLTPLYGLVPCLMQEGLLEQNGAWYTFNGKKFQGKELPNLLNDTSVKEFDLLREKLGLSSTEASSNTIIKG